jgi:hypothetical protein
VTRRAVLIAPRVGGSGETPTSLKAMLDAMDEMARAGFELVGVLDPKDHLEAHRMIADGVADVIVVTRPDHLPTVRVVADKAWFARPARTPDSVPPGVVRRPRPVLRPEEPEPDEPDTVTRWPGATEDQRAPRRTQRIYRGQGDLASGIPDASPAATEGPGEPAIPRQRRSQLIKRGDAEVVLDGAGVPRARRRPRAVG